MLPMNILPPTTLSTICFIISIFSLPTTMSAKTNHNRPASQSLTTDQAATLIRNALRHSPGQLIGRIRPDEIAAYRAWIARQNSAESDRSVVSSEIELFNCENTIIPKPILEPGRCEQIDKYPMCVSVSAAKYAPNQCGKENRNESSNKDVIRESID
ncbi:uncharacterized protein LOC141854527 [Brevipalpus obovatus]|uniref:uncharacterized protein LOC141854527 n=1 Tax=Brevipalpus obovatus TaxID=246614 RepID=UPI003D9E986F